MSSRTLNGLPSGLPSQAAWNSQCRRLARSAARNPIERFFNKTKQGRRITSRQDLAANYLAFVEPVAFRIWLRAYQSTLWSKSCCQ
jgi:transposase